MFELLQDNRNLLPDGPSPLSIPRLNAQELLTCLVEAVELYVIRRGGACEAADEVIPHQVPLLGCNFDSHICQ